MVYCQIDFLKRNKNPDETKIRDDLVLHGMNRAEAYKIEYNTIGAFKNSYSNTPGYHIFQWISNAYTLHGKYTCHAFGPPVIIPEGKLVCPTKFVTPIRKTPYWYHDPDEEIPIMVKLKQVVMSFVELIQYNNTTKYFAVKF